MTIHRPLGKSEDELNAIGLGCMGLSIAYGLPTEKSAAVKLLHEAIELGVDHFDTAELYGFGANESILGEAFKDRRNRVFIATKFGPIPDIDAKGVYRGIKGVDGSRENCRRAVENSLRFLQTDHIDLYYLHRMDPNRPIEETVEAIAELVQEGKIRHIGLSEASAETLRRASKVHPIAAVQSEYSIFSRDIEETLFPALKECGACLVAYSPLGRGMLTGHFTTANKPGSDDYRSEAHQPRFAAGAYEANLELVEEVKRIADHLGAIAAQVALAWVLARGDFIITIPGTTKLKNLQANLGAAEVKLSEKDMEQLNVLADKVRGERYNQAGMKAINR